MMRNFLELRAFVNHSIMQLEILHRQYRGCIIRKDYYRADHTRALLHTKTKIILQSICDYERTMQTCYIQNRLWSSRLENLKTNITKYLYEEYIIPAGPRKPTQC